MKFLKISLLIAINFHFFLGIKDQLLITSYLSNTKLSNQNRTLTKRICRIIHIYKEGCSLSFLLCSSYKIYLNIDEDSKLEDFLTFKLNSVYLASIFKQDDSNDSSLEPKKFPFFEHVSSLKDFKNEEEMFKKGYRFFIYEAEDKYNPTKEKLNIFKSDFENHDKNKINIEYEAKKSINFLFFNFEVNIIKNFDKEIRNNELKIIFKIYLRFYEYYTKNQFWFDQALGLKISLINDFFDIFENFEKKKSKLNSNINGRESGIIKRGKSFRYPTENERKTFLNDIEFIILGLPEKEKNIINNMKIKNQFEGLRKNDVKHLKNLESIKEKESNELKGKGNDKGIVISFAIMILFSGFLAVSIFVIFICCLKKQNPKL